MSLARATAYAAAVFAGTGTLMLGISEDNYLLAVLAVVMSASALVLCDLNDWFRLKTWSSNLASLVALAVATVEYRLLPADARVLALADLLGYLQFVLQFKTKTIHTYWMLTLVSFLQVSVASALHTGPLFAVLMIAYLFASLVFLGLFYLYREELRFAPTADFSTAAATGRSTLSARPESAPAGPILTGDWTRRFVNLGLGTIGLSALFFAAVPRVVQTKWVPTVIAATPTVGFTPEINLERSGQLLEDPEVVMQVRFVDPETGRPYQVDSEPYLRGTSVSHYYRGRWRGGGSVGAHDDVPPASSLASAEGLISQRVTIEPLSSHTVFACAPAFLDEETDALEFNAYVGRIERTESSRARRFSYDLLTGAFRNHRQVDLFPAFQTPQRMQSLLELPRSDDGGGDPLAQLKATALAVTDGINPNDLVTRARALEAYLRDSGRFQYTLDSLPRPEGIDPLEDFVADNPRGHCEYFAGALTLMLRSIGIPARVVLGFRGGEWNVVGNFYQVRQLNAHSWVEIYLRPDQVPLDRLATPSLNDLAHHYGAWLRLEPTAGNGPLYDTARDSLWGEIVQVADYLKFLWNNYVLGMDATKQQESIYQPAIDAVQASLLSLAQLRTWRDAAWYWINPVHWLPENVPLLSRRGGLWISGLIAAVWGVGFVVRFLWRRFRRRTAAATARRPGRKLVPVEFYVRLEATLRRWKLTRTPEQTQREFVLAACGELAESPTTRGISTLPRTIVDAYYRVRFGGRPLNDAERAEVESALTALAAALPEPTSR